MNFLKQDVWYAVRKLRSSRGFTLAAVLTLALGVGANITVFLVAYGVLLRPLPFPHPDRIVRLVRSYPDGVAPAYSGTKFLFMRRTNRTLDAAAAYDYIPAIVNLVQNGNAVPIKADRVTSDFFSVLQMQPEIGRGFSQQDMIPSAPGTAVLSDALWRERFGSDPNILGEAITLGSQKYTVVGVARPELRLDAKVDVWTPLRISEAPGDRSNDYNFVARMKPGVTLGRRKMISGARYFNSRAPIPICGISMSRYACLIFMILW